MWWRAWNHPGAPELAATGRTLEWSVLPPETAKDGRTDERSWCIFLADMVEWGLCFHLEESSKMWIHICERITLSGVFLFRGFSIFTCKRSDKGMSDCTNRMEVSNSESFLVTVALVVLAFPALFAITCSDRCRSCDSSGMSSRMKMTSNRDRIGEPILKQRIRQHKV